MKVFYVSTSGIRSFWRTAREYGALIGDRHEVTRDPAEADCAVLHLDPPAYAHALRAYPTLAGKPLIGYSLWEADRLAPAYEPGLRMVRELWTPSRYCRAAYARCHPRVVRVPHVVERDTTVDPRVRERVRRAVGHRPGRLHFLTVLCTPVVPRKNLGQLIDAFCAVQRDLPEARLVVKLDRPPGEFPGYREHPAIVYHVAEASDAELNALYELADVYVSAHHAEGWGLTMSDALAFRKPVVATGYSGNLDYMAADTSFLVASEVEPIRPEDRFWVYDGTMRWAYPDERDLERLLLRAAGAVVDGSARGRAEEAARRLRQFSRAAVGELVAERLDAIADEELCG